MITHDANPFLPQFLSRFVVSPPGCWIWRGSFHVSGEPQMSHHQRKILARRYAYSVAMGEEPSARIVPLCGVQACVNPDHAAPCTDERHWFWPRLVSGGDGCLEWPGERDSDGYGRTGKKTGSRGAHRVAWEATHGPIGDGMEVCHHCDNPPCCNPEHLFLGTRAENQRDMTEKARQARGVRSGMAKLTDEQVREIRRLVTEGAGREKIAGRFGITRQNVTHIERRVTWQHVDQDPGPAFPWARFR